MKLQKNVATATTNPVSTRRYVRIFHPLRFAVEAVQEVKTTRELWTFGGAQKNPSEWCLSFTIPLNYSKIKMNIHLLGRRERR